MPTIRAQLFSPRCPMALSPSSTNLVRLARSPVGRVPMTANTITATVGGSCSLAELEVIARALCRNSDGSASGVVSAVVDRIMALK